MAVDHPVIDKILRRRSVSPQRLMAPGPDTGSIELLVEAVLAAPDHARLHPWRFASVGPEQREALAALFAEAAREIERSIGDEALQRAAGKARNAPCLIAVIARIDQDNPIVPASEQWMSVVAALQNILLAAEDLGFRAMIVSGKKVDTKTLRNAFTGSASEHLIGFVAIGTPAAQPTPIERASVCDKLTTWAGGEL